MNSDYISYEALLAARQSAYWAKLAMLGTWFSGVATLLAVMTSLYIALKDRMALIGGKVRSGHIFTENYEGPFISVTIVNRSLHSIRIKAIFWNVGGEIEIQQHFEKLESDPLPKRLEYGDEAHYRILLRNDVWLQKMAQRLTKLNVRPNKLRCIVALSTGERRVIKVDKRVVEKIRQFM